MHADDHPQGQGGELKHDTAAIIGHTLDLQEKVVKDAMTPIDNVRFRFLHFIGSHIDDNDIDRSSCSPSIRSLTMRL